MQVKGLCFRTELIFHKHDAKVEDRENHLYIETPSNPTFHWGNLLYFAQPPQPEDGLRWLTLFKKSFAHNPKVKHVTLAWDGGREDASTDFFEERGFELDTTVTLTAQKLIVPPPLPKEFVLKKIVSDLDWSQVVELQVLCRDAIFNEKDYRTYKLEQMKNRRALAETGVGHWFGVFKFDNLVSDLGIYWDGALARYQQVETHPEFRNLGLCKNLLFHASEVALSAGNQELVISADHSYHAVKIYKSMGFREVEFPGSVSWHEALGTPTALLLPTSF